MKAQIENITPETAASMLKGKNRPIIASAVDRYVKDMLSGNFKLTHQGIAISDEGDVIDGQHRLMAVIKSGKTVPMLIIRNADKSTFDVLDSGKNRSRADVLALSGLNPRTSRIVSAAIPFCFNFDRTGGIDRTIKWTQGSATLVARDYVEKNPGIIRSAEYIELMPRKNALIR